MPVTHADFLLTYYRLIIVILLNHNIRLAFLLNRLFWPNRYILFINWIINRSLHGMGVTIDHNLKILSRNTKLITWHDVLSSLLTSGPYNNGFLSSQKRISLQLLECLWYSYRISVHSVAIWLILNIFQVQRSSSITLLFFTTLFNVQCMMDVCIAVRQDYYFNEILEHRIKIV